MNLSFNGLDESLKADAHKILIAIEVNWEFGFNKQINKA